MTATRVLALLLMAALSPIAYSREWSADQLEVWSRLTSCWAMFETGPFEDFAACYHEDYIGWYFEDPVPMPFSEKYIKFIQERTPRLIHVLQPREILIHGNTAIAHYSALVAVQGEDGEAISAWESWTDTLVKEGGVWQILGDHGHTHESSQ